METTNYATLFANARAKENEQEAQKAIAYEKQYQALKKKCNEFAKDAMEMSKVITQANDNGYFFREGKSPCSGSDKPNCIGYAYTDTWNHRLGFYQRTNTFNTCIGYAGGGANGDNVVGEIIFDDNLDCYTIAWTFGRHFSERNWYLNKFLEDFPKFKEQFYNDIHKKFGDL